MASSHRSFINHLGRENISSTRHDPAGGLMTCTYAKFRDNEQHFTQEHLDIAINAHEVTKNVTL